MSGMLSSSLAQNSSPFLLFISKISNCVDTFCAKTRSFNTRSQRINSKVKKIEKFKLFELLVSTLVRILLKTYN